MDDADLEVADEHHDLGSGEGSADADVVQSAVVAQGDRAVFVDAVVADPELRVGLVLAGHGFGTCCVGGGGGGVVRE